MERPDGRRWDELRPVTITRHYTRFAEGAVLIEMGDTRVVCTATVDAQVPLFLRGKAQGWITAEYGMLPRSTQERNQREAARGRPGGRTLEIQRLIGRSLRATVDLEALGERTIIIDCDVLQADGGTRTAAITGSFVALTDACAWLLDRGELKRWPLRDLVVAVSVGMVGGQACLDLSYPEDAAARVDMNAVLTGSGQLVEIQGTGELAPFSREELNLLLDLAQKGASALVTKQKEALGPELAGRCAGGVVA